MVPKHACLGVLSVFLIRLSIHVTGSVIVIVTVKYMYECLKFGGFVSPQVARFLVYQTGPLEEMVRATGLGEDSAYAEYMTGSYGRHSSCTTTRVPGSASIHLHIHIYISEYRTLYVYMYVCISSYRPQVALKIIVPKMRHEDEKVAMLSLTVSPSSTNHLSFSLQRLYAYASFLITCLCLSIHSSCSSSLLSCLVVVGGMREELWPAIPPRIGQISLPQ